jgi:hypothetical protein
MQLHRLALGISGVLLFAACGDDSGTNNIDANTTPDSNTGADAATPDGPSGVTLQSPEGGEVRFEYMEWPANSGPVNNNTTATRVIAYFIKNQDPQWHPIPEIGQCNSFLNGADMWPLHQSATREYVDVGNVVLSGGPSDLQVPLGGTDGVGTDPLGRMHDHFYFYFGADDTDTYVTDNHAYNVVFTGSDEWPAQAFPNAIFMPHAYTPTNPAVVDITLTAGTALNMTWPAATSNTPPGVGVFSFVAFANATAGVTHLCPAPDEGSFTVSAATVDEVLGSNTSGFFLRGTLTHQLVELKDGSGVSGRRIDMLGIYCFISNYTST